MGYLNRFDQEDSVHLLFFVGNVLIAVFCGIPLASCGEADADAGDAHRQLTVDRSGHNCANFAFPIAAGRFWVAAAWFYCFCCTEEKRAQKVDRVATAFPLVLMGCLWLATAFVIKNSGAGVTEWGAPVAMWWVCIAGDVGFFLLRMPMYLRSTWGRCVRFEGKLSLNPVNVPLIVERQSLFLLLSLGEVLTAAVGEVDAQQTTDGEQAHLYVTCVLVVFVGVLIKSLYFDLADRPSTSGAVCQRYGKHALSKSAVRGIWWTLLCMPINACIVVVGAMLEIFVANKGQFGPEEEEETEAEDAKNNKAAMDQIWMLGGALGVLCLPVKLFAEQCPLRLLNAAFHLGVAFTQPWTGFSLLRGALQCHDRLLTLHQPVSRFCRKHFFRSNVLHCTAITTRILIIG